MLKTVIIGAGGIAYCHAQALSQLGVKIAGVFDINQEAAAKLAGKCGVPVVDDLERAVSTADLVHLCTPPSLRVAYAEMAMQAGCHVITEKPISISLKDADLMISAAKRYGVKLMVDFNHRFREGTEKLIELARSGALGKVYNVFADRKNMLGGNFATASDTWRKNPKTACGMSIESLAHDLDLLIQIAGPVREIKADVLGTDPNVPAFDNHVNAAIRFESGALGMIHASWCSHISGGERGVIGSKGTAVLEGDDIFSFSRLRYKTTEMENARVIELEDDYDKAYYNINKYFMDCIENNKEPATSGEYAAQILALSHGILESSYNHSVWTSDRKWDQNESI